MQSHKSYDRCHTATYGVNSYHFFKKELKNETQTYNY